MFISLFVVMFLGLPEVSHVTGCSGGGIAASVVGFSPTPLEQLLGMGRVPSPPDAFPDYSATPLGKVWVAVGSGRRVGAAG